MKRKIAGVAVMLCFALLAYAQCDSASGFMKQLCQAQTGNFTKMAPEAAVTTTLSDAIHGTTLPPSFNPPLFKDLSSLNRADSGAFVLKPGFYQMTAQSYAIGGSVDPGAGFYPAPIKGPKAKAVSELLKNAELHSELGQGDIQAVLNVILSGAALNSLPQRQQQAAATLLSADSLQQMRASGQGGVLADKVASLMQRHIPGAAQQGIASAQARGNYTDQKYGVSDTLNTFGGMDTGQAPVVAAIPHGTWAQMPGGFYVRYLADNAARTRIEIAVPDAAAAGGQLTFDPTQYLAVSGGTPCVRLGLSMRSVR